MRIRGAVLEQIGLPRPYAESRPLAVHDLDLAPPGAGELLVRIEAAGVCHSDLSVVDGNRVRPLPMLLGHEAAGVVEEVGPGVADAPVGQRLVMTFLPRCGDCDACATNGLTPCEPGSAANAAGTLMTGGRRLSRDGDPVHHHLGVSGFATHAVVDRRSVVPVPADVPPEVASLLGCAVLTGGGAVINAGRPQPGQTVVVVGLGGVGMAAVLTALSHDDVRVIGVDQAAREARPGANHGRPRRVHAGGGARSRAQGRRGDRGGRPSAGGGDCRRPDGRRRPDRLRRATSSGRSNQSVAVGFCRRGPVADRQLPRLGRALARDSALRRPVAGGPTAGRVAGVLDDRDSTTSTTGWTNSPTAKRCGRSFGSTRRGLCIRDAGAPQ